MSGWRITHRLCVKTGSYTDREGNEKNRYERIGKIMRGPNPDDRMICINRTFNPAGLPHDGFDTITLVAFEESDREERKQEANRNKNKSSSEKTSDPDDDIPF